MKSFADATAVRPRSGTSFEADLSAQWAVGDKLHGGYLMAVLGRAAAAQSDHPHLTAITTSFVAAPRPGMAMVSVEVLRAGRSSTQLRARLVQDDCPRAEALITQGVLEEAEPWWSVATAPDFPPEHDCVHAPSSPPGAPFPVPLLDVVEHRLDPSDLGFVVGKPSMAGRVAAWLRLADGTDWDPLSLLIALDMVPPVSLTLGMSSWAPTVSFTAYLRRLPAAGPIRVALHATDVTAHRMDETATAWDTTGRLIAQATQLAAVRTPEDTLR